jgi:hypothetical protein
MIDIDIKKPPKHDTGAGIAQTFWSCTRASIDIDRQRSPCTCTCVGGRALLAPRRGSADPEIGVATRLDRVALALVARSTLVLRIQLSPILHVCANNVFSSWLRPQLHVLLLPQQVLSSDCMCLCMCVRVSVQWFLCV